MEFNGYQQAILYLLGYWQEKRYLVRCVDKHYIDAVAPLFERTRPFLQHRTGEKKDYWCIKSASAENFTPPTLDDVDDWPAFSRAVVELQGIVDLRKVSSHGVPQRRLFAAGSRQSRRKCSSSGRTTERRMRSFINLRRKCARSSITSTESRGTRLFG